MRFGRKALAGCGVGCLAAITLLVLIVVGSTVRPTGPKDRRIPQAGRDHHPAQSQQDSGTETDSTTTEARFTELRRLLDQDMPFLALKEARGLREEIDDAADIAPVEELITEIEEYIRAKAQRAAAEQRSKKRRSDSPRANPSDLQQARQFLDDLPPACARSKHSVGRDGTVTITISCEGANGSLNGTVKIKDGIVTEIR